MIMDSTNTKLLKAGFTITHKWSFVKNKACAYISKDGKQIERPSLGNLSDILKKEFDFDFL